MPLNRARRCAGSGAHACMARARLHASPTGVLPLSPPFCLTFLTHRISHGDPILLHHHYAALWRGRHRHSWQRCASHGGCGVGLYGRPPAHEDERVQLLMAGQGRRWRREWRRGCRYGCRCGCRRRHPARAARGRHGPHCGLPAAGPADGCDQQHRHDSVVRCAACNARCPTFHFSWPISHCPLPASPHQFSPLRSTPASPRPPAAPHGAGRHGGVGAVWQLHVWHQPLAVPLPRTQSCRCMCRPRPLLSFR